MREQEVTGRRQEKWMAVGSAVLNNIGLIFGKKRSVTGVSSVLTKNRMEDNAEARLEQLRAEIAALETQLAQASEVDPARFEEQALAPVRGGVTLLRFGPPELSYADGVVSSRYAIDGGLLAVRAGGTVTLEQRLAGEGVELTVSVEEYLPRLAARVGAPRWTGLLYARAQSPLHVAVSRRYFESLARGSQ